MFSVNDRVALKEEHLEHYRAGDVCTVKKVIHREGRNAVYGIMSDTDPEFNSLYFVRAEDIVLTTNVPSEPVRPRGSDLQPQTPDGVRAFGTGATRDLDANKLDFEGFISPLALERYAEHMHKARRMPDGSMRESDNWQRGIPMDVYMKSLWRHFFAVWKLHRGLQVTEVVKGETIVKDLETELCALLFNANGMLHETLKAK